jgi:antitoxin (DNA-binding transcriptional repressor) of toxin-antitoxin stability system
MSKVLVKIAGAIVYIKVEHRLLTLRPSTFDFFSLLTNQSFQTSHFNMKASVMDLRYRTKEILRALDAKEEITLTHRGTTKGTIVPVKSNSKASKALASHPAIGMWSDQNESVGELMTRIRKPRSC